MIERLKREGGRDSLVYKTFAPYSIIPIQEK